MAEDWLQLTEEDIARARQLTRARPPMPEIISITEADIPADAPMITTSSRIITITSDDLAPAKPQTSTTQDLRQLEALMYDLTNGARKSHLPGWVGTAFLTWDDELAAVARGHSADMLKRQYVAHITPEGITASKRIETGRISYVACGENIGVFYGEAALSTRAIQDIHYAFMKQPRSLTNHRGNILNPIWTHIGIGVAYNPAGTLVATQNFISAPAARIRGR